MCCGTGTVVTSSLTDKTAGSSLLAHEPVTCGDGNQTSQSASSLIPSRKPFDGQFQERPEGRRQIYIQHTGPKA